MSKTAVIVALLLAIGLAAAAYFLTGAPVRPPVGPLMSFNMAGASEIRMDYPDGSYQAVRRGSGSEWSVVLGAPNKPERSWPASITQVHAALRIFSALMPDEQGGRAVGEIDSAAGTLTVTAEGAKHVLRIGSQKLAGKVMVESPGPPGQTAWVRGDLSDMLIATGPKAWRDTAALPGVGSEVSYISVKGQTGASVTLNRVKGSWALAEPWKEAADLEAISRLTSLLGSVRIVDFCDKGPPTQTGLEAPVATLTVESTSRDERGASTIRRTIRVGSSADLGGGSFVADISRNDSRTPGAEQSQVVILASEQLAAISADPLKYVAKVACAASPEDIGRVVVTIPTRESPCRMTEFRRAADGWESTCDQKDWKPVSKAEAAEVVALIELCTTTAPEAILKAGARQVPAAMGTVQFLSLGGAPIGGLSVVIEGARLTIVTENVLRDYPAGIGKVVAEWFGRR